MIKRLIKCEEDHDLALSRINELMGAKRGTSAMDELELLTALVEMYEERHFPIAPPGPIDAIRFRMDQLGLGQKDMIPFLGTKGRVSEILNGKRTLTLAMMRALNQGLGISAEVLLKEPGARFPDEVKNVEWSRFPVAEMIERCWIPKVDSPGDRVEEVMRGFIARSGGLGTVQAALLRQGSRGRHNPKMDPYALTAWCLRVLAFTEMHPLNSPYVKGSIKRSTLREVARLSYFDNGPLLAREFLEKHGIHLIVVPHLPRTYLDGAAIMTKGGTPVIGLTLRYDRIDNFWYCLLHELAHVSKHLSSSDRLIVDDLDLHGKGGGTEDRIEKEADEMTREGLIPQKVWDKWSIEGKGTTAAVYELAARLKIHPAIIAGRIRYEQNNYRLLSRHVGTRGIRKHFSEQFTAGLL